MGEHLDRAIAALDEIDGMAFGKVSAALDSLQTNLLLAKTEAEKSSATIDALVGVLDEVRGAVSACPDDTWGNVQGETEHGELIEWPFRRELLTKIDSALQLARGSKGDE